MRSVFVFILVLGLARVSIAQNPDHLIQHSLHYEGGGEFWHGSTTISFPADRYRDSLWLHLPPRALVDSSSQLRSQWEEFQDVDLHFADASEHGSLSIDSAFLGNRSLSICENCEMTALNLPDASHRDDSLSIRLYYRLRLPNASFSGSGRQGSLQHFIDWLPRIPQYEGGKWLRYPANFFHDSYFALDSFRLQLSLPQDVQPVANLHLSKNNKSSQGMQEWEGAGRARSLQVHLLKDFHQFQGESGITWYCPKENSLSALMGSAALGDVQHFLRRELGDSLNHLRSVVVLPKKYGDYQSESMLTIEASDKLFELSRSLAGALAESTLRYRLHPDGFRYSWLARGLPYFYKYSYIQERFPEERWVPYGDTWLGQLLALDDFDYTYQNKFLYLFLARQGLDQSMDSRADSLTRLNYEAIAKAKSALAWEHLRQYLSPRDFRRGISRYLKENDGQTVTDSAIRKALGYYSFKDISWFFDTLVPSADYYDYQITDIDHCPTVSTATLRNRGKLAVPFSLTGYRDGEPVLTEWFEGHTGQRSVQMHHAEYDKVVVNDHRVQPEYSQKNNQYSDRLLLPRAESLSFAFFNSFEKPDATQIFYTPSAAYNAYDQLLFGLNLSNASVLMQKPLEYNINPTFSTGTSRLTGSGSLRYNWTLPKSHYFRQISAGAFARYFHYDRDLSFFRFSPAVIFRFRKPYSRSPLIQTLRLRGVSVDRQMPSDVSDREARQQGARYDILDFRYRLENTSILNPTILNVNAEYAGDFSKLHFSLDQRWMLPNKRWLVWRSFGGVFTHVRDDNFLNENFFRFGLSGTPDYLFDYYFIGRSDQQGIWSQQFFTTDGGFKGPTGVYARRFMLANNISLPIYSFVGLFGDVAVADENLYWDYGVRLAFLTDFVELYLPLQNQDFRFWESENYWAYMRFVLDLDLNNIINRVRRGFY